MLLWSGTIIKVAKYFWKQVIAYAENGYLVINVLGGNEGLLEH
jgi:hypothetical protein